MHWLAATGVLIPVVFALFTAAAAGQAAQSDPEPVAPDTVDWELAVSNNGENWTPIWRMAMTRKVE